MTIGYNGFRKLRFKDGPADCRTRLICPTSARAVIATSWSVPAESCVAERAFTAWRTIFGTTVERLCAVYYPSD